MGGWEVKVKMHIPWHALQTGLPICLKITVSVFNIFKLLPNPAVSEDGIEMYFIGTIFGHSALHIMLLMDVCVVLQITFVVILIIFWSCKTRFKKFLIKKFISSKGERGEVKMGIIIR